MQPSVTLESAGFPMSEPGLGVLGLTFAVALSATFLGHRVALVPRLRAWHRWLAPLGSLAWLTSVWLMGLRLLASASWPELAARGVLLVLFGVAALPLGRDLWAGLFASFEGRFRLGDDVRIGAVEGRVAALGVRSMVIRQEDGAELVIAHARVASEACFRLGSTVRDVACEFEVGLPEGMDLEQARRLLAEVAILSPYAAPGRRPEVFVVGRQGDALQIRTRGFAFDRACVDLYRGDVLARLDDRFKGQH